MGTCVHFSRSLPSNSWWQTMAGWQALSRPPAAEGGGRRPAFTGLATQPYSATEVDGWQHKAQPGVSKPGRSTFKWYCTELKEAGIPLDVIKHMHAVDITTFDTFQLDGDPYDDPEDDDDGEMVDVTPKDTA